MPSHPCRTPTCTAYVPRRGDHCPAHAEQGKRERRERDRYYDRHVRDPEAKAFYNSSRWLRVRAAVLADDPVCKRCRRAWAAHVHHKKPLADCTDDEKVDRANLMGVCVACHNQLEKEADYAVVPVAERANRTVEKSWPGRH